MHAAQVLMLTPRNIVEILLLRVFGSIDTVTKPYNKWLQNFQKLHLVAFKL